MELSFVLSHETSDAELLACEVFRNLHIVGKLVEHLEVNGAVVTSVGASSFGSGECHARNCDILMHHVERNVFESHFLSFHRSTFATLHCAFVNRDNFLVAVVSHPVSHEVLDLVAVHKLVGEVAVNQAVGVGVLHPHVAAILVDN